jgi:uncharacterized surface protein with fasciclin (FAS1) repeats
MSLKGAWRLAAAGCVGWTSAAAQASDSAAAASVGVYYAPVEPSAPVDTSAADPASSDTTAKAEAEAAPAAVEQPEDTSLTAQMDVRRGGGLRRAWFSDLWTAASLSGQYRTFLELLERAQLRPRLTADSILTLLAPTDSAFGRLPRSTLERLRQEPAFRDAWLDRVLLTGSRSSEELVGEGKVALRDGTVLEFSREEDGSIYAGPARVVQPDIAASNGLLHGVDMVTLPDTTSASP